MEIDSDAMHLAVTQALAEENAILKVDLYRLRHIVEVLSAEIETPTEPDASAAMASPAVEGTDSQATPPLKQVE